jgi:hypothetical protein
MKAHHIDKCRAAGSYFLLAFLVRFRPFFRFICSSHVPAKPNVIKVVKSQLFHGFLPACSSNVRAKLPFCCRRSHCIDFLARFQCFHNIHNICFGTDSAKGAAMDAFPATDAFFLINNGNPMLIVCNGVNWAAMLTRAL